MGDVIDLTQDDSFLETEKKPNISVTTPVKRKSAKKELLERKYRSFLATLEPAESHRIHKCFQQVQSEKNDIISRRRANMADHGRQVKNIDYKPGNSEYEANVLERRLLDACLVTLDEWTEKLRTGEVRGSAIETMEANTRRLANGLRSRIETSRKNLAISKLQSDAYNRSSSLIKEDKSYSDARSNSLVTPTAPTAHSNYKPNYNPANMHQEIIRRTRIDPQSTGMMPDMSALPSSHPYNPYTGYTDRDIWDINNENDTYSEDQVPDVKAVEAAYEQLVELAMKDPQPLDMPPQLNVSVLEHQRQGLGWLVRAETGGNKGSILADDMGLGKTVQTIALMYANMPNLEKYPDHKMVLIVCPVALIQTWQQELDTRVLPGYKMRVYVHHRGTNPHILQNAAQIEKNYDVIICTYQGVVNEFKQKIASSENRTHQPHPLFDIQYHRIVLDEAHLIKNRVTQMSIAVSRLHSKYRLALTGTPMQNKIDELYPLVRFLRIEPYWKSFSLFSPLIPSTALSKDHFDSIAQRFATLLCAIMLRRRKDTIINGKKIIDNLPPKTIKNIEVYMEPTEKDVYDKLQSAVAHKLSQAEDMDYTNMLVLLLKLRMKACHPLLNKISRLRTLGSPVLGRNKEAKRQIAAVKSLDEQILHHCVHVRRFNRVCAWCSNMCGNPENTYATNTCGHFVCDECYGNIVQEISESTSIQRCAECNKVFQYLPNLEIMEIVDQLGVHTPVDTILDRLITLQMPRSASEKQSERERQEKIQRLQIDAMEKNLYFESDDDSELDFGDVFSDSSFPCSADHKISAKENGTNDEIELNSSSDSEPDLYEDLEADKNPIQQPFVLKLARNDPMYYKIDIDELARLFPIRDVFLEGWLSSTKVNSCIDILNKIFKKAPFEKVIIFTSFTTLIDVMSVPLEAAMIPFLRYTGAMSIEDRNSTLKNFKDGNCRVLLTSLRAGNVGLTLTEANHVILMEPFWNPYVEEQAQDRVYRIGQSRPVTIYRLRVKGTVEDRIVELQDNKRELIESALDPNVKTVTRGLSKSEMLYALVGSRRQPQNTSTDNANIQIEDSGMTSDDNGYNPIPHQTNFNFA